MAGQAGNPVNHPISPHVIGGAFVQQYYQILHEQPDQVHKFYQDSSILGRPDSNGTMVYVSTMSAINEKIMAMDVRNCLTEIETADAQLSHKDGVLIVVTGSLTSEEGVFRRFTQSFFLAPQESGGYFVLTDIFRFILERKPAEIIRVATQENEISQNGRPASETCSALPEPIPADRNVISDHVTAESNVTERQISDRSANGAAIENNVKTQPPVQVPKEDPKKALVAASLPPPTQTDVTKKSYASIVKVMKEGPLTSPVAKTTSSVSKQKPAPKPVSKAVDGLEKPSVKPTQAIETGDGIVAQNNSSRNEQGYSIFVKNLPYHANIEMVEEEFKKFGTIKPGGVQVRHNKVDRYVFGFVEYESQQSMQAAIEASPVHMEDKEVGIEAKRANSRGGRFQSGRGVYHGDNYFRGRGSGYVDNANYRSSDNFNRRNEGEMYNRRNEGEFYNRRNDGGENYIRRNDGGENYNRRNDGGENYNRRNDGGENYNRRNEGGGENFNRRNDGGGENYNRRNDGGENFNRRNDGGGENFNRRNDGGGENFNRRNDGGENFNRRNDGGGENFNRRNDGGENFNRRNDDGENFNRRNNFRNQNEFPGRGRGPPPPGNSYHQNGNGVHPSRPYQNGNGWFSRVNNGPKQAPVAA